MAERFSAQAGARQFFSPMVKRAGQIVASNAGRRQPLLGYKLGGGDGVVELDKPAPNRHRVVLLPECELSALE